MALFVSARGANKSVRARVLVFDRVHAGPGGAETAAISLMLRTIWLQ